jgi:hypothetical protein
MSWKEALTFCHGNWDNNNSIYNRVLSYLYVYVMLSNVNTVALVNIFYLSM